MPPRPAPRQPCLLCPPAFTRWVPCGQELEFEFELNEFNDPGTFDKDHWELSAAERWEAIPIRKEAKPPSLACSLVLRRRGW
jgi:hypothetical protein